MKGRGEVWGGGREVGGGGGGRERERVNECTGLTASETRLFLQ